jgi:hypothetical protein
LLNIHDLKRAYEQAIGHATSNSTVYDLLARRGWRKLMPRPHHPTRDAEFLGFSYGFRPGRNPHMALSAWRTAIMSQRVNWVLEGSTRES